MVRYVPMAARLSSVRYLYPFRQSSPSLIGPRNTFRRMKITPLNGHSYSSCVIFTRHTVSFSQSYYLVVACSVTISNLDFRRLNILNFCDIPLDRRLY